MFDELGNLKEVDIPNFINVKVIVRGLADVVQFKLSSGASSLSPLYPICEASEHSSQFGDMTIYRGRPIWITGKQKTLRKIPTLVGYKKRQQ